MFFQPSGIRRSMPHIPWRSYDPHHSNCLKRHPSKKKRETGTQISRRLSGQTNLPKAKVFCFPNTQCMGYLPTCMVNLYGKGRSIYHTSGQMEEYLTNLDFTKIAGDFPYFSPPFQGPGHVKSSALLVGSYLCCKFTLFWGTNFNQSYRG